MSTALNLDLRPDGIAVAYIHQDNGAPNTLDAAFPDALSAVLERMEDDGDILGLVFASQRRDFAAGADLHMFDELQRSVEATVMSRRAQELMQRLHELGKPSAAAIAGNCLGAGLELALACTHRVASDDAELGQPEVKLGLIPGAGATQRLPALIGLQNALELMLGGRAIGAREARQLGLVHDTCPRSIVVEVACRRILDGAKRNPDTSLATRLGRMVREDNPLGRRFVLDQARKTTRARTRGNYPAPERLIEVVRIGLEEGMRAGLEAEAVAFGELAVSRVARELRRLFFLRKQVEAHQWVDPGVERLPLRRVGVLGAGLMGAGIAGVTAADAGLPVHLQDIDVQTVATGLRSIREMTDRARRKGAMTELEQARCMHRVSGTTRPRGLDKCHLIIEAVFEEVELKRELIRELEAFDARLIIASNTSSIPIRRLAAGSDHPERIIGMHYFSPVPRMPLVEIAVTADTSPEVLATCVDLARRQGKTAIVVNDGPGFYTTRILAAYLSEAVALLRAGASVERIDDALVAFGFPLGPFAMIDAVGLLVAEKIAGSLSAQLGNRFNSAAVLTELIEHGRLGKTSGCGFYSYADGREPRVEPELYSLLAVERNSRIHSDDISWRCALRMADEAVRCYADGVLRSTRDGDVGAVLGLGFPPFRGGPFRLIEAMGARQVVELLHDYDMEPSPLLVGMASGNVRPEQVSPRLGLH